MSNQTLGKSVCNIIFGMAVVALVGVTASCVDGVVAFDRSNPFDELATNYQGYPTVATPEEFVLASPVGDDLAAVFMPQLMVAEVIGADGYEMQVSTTDADDFAAGLEFDSGIQTANLVLPLSVEPRLGPYYWRARCTADGVPGEWVSPQHFELTSAFDTASFVPANGDYAASAPRLQWAAVSGAARYEVQTGSSSPEMASATPVETNTASHQVADADFGEILYWRVRAVDGLGLRTAWSSFSRVERNLTVGFEGGSMPAGFGSSGTPWSVVSSGAYAGSYCAKAGSISHSGSSWMTTSGTVPAGASSLRVGFAYRVNSESGYDYLIWRVNSSEQERWSGDIGWSNTSATVSVTPGQSYTIEWGYTKDGSVSRDDDTAWIDEIDLSWN